MPKVLVIDDDPMIRRALTKVLVRNGYEVITATDGDHGLRVFRQEHPNIVITDIIMPEQEGIETIIKIKREMPGAKIVAMSGGGRISKADLLQSALLLGADEIVRKPFDQQELLRCLERLGANGATATTGPCPVDPLATTSQWRADAKDLVDRR